MTAIVRDIFCIYHYGKSTIYGFLGLVCLGSAGCGALQSLEDRLDEADSMGGFDPFDPSADAGDEGGIEDGSSATGDTAREDSGGADSEMDEDGTISIDAEIDVEYDFDCLTVDQIVGPQVLPPAGLRVNFRVLDCDGNPVPPLAEDSIEIINDEKNEAFGEGFEGGSVSGLAVPTSYGLASVVALDMSASIFNADAVDDVIDGALAYLDQVQEAQPEVPHDVALIAFGRPDAYEIVQDFTHDHDMLVEQLEALRGSENRGSTDLYGAYSSALELIDSRSSAYELSERFVVILTDGTHEAGNEEEMRNEALQALENSSANVYSVGIDGAYDTERLEELASTEANFMHVRDADALGTAFRRVANRVGAVAHSNYSVGICTPISLGEPSLTINIAMTAPSGERVEVSKTLNYDVSALDGDVSGCDANASTQGILACSAEKDWDGDGDLDETCRQACVAMGCGCDQGVDCGSCGDDMVCDGEFSCVEADTLDEDEEDEEDEIEPMTCEEAGGIKPIDKNGAQGITIADVYGNQAVTMTLARNGAALEAGQFSARVVAGRDMIVNATWSLDPSWQAREVYARLTVLTPDGESSEYADTARVEAASTAMSFAHSFAWGVDGSLLEPGSRYVIQLFENEPGSTNATPPPRFPAEGSADLGANSTEATVHLTLVPIVHQVGGCTNRPSDMEVVREDYIDYLMRTYPVADVDVSIREAAITWTGDFSPQGWTNLLARTSQTKSADGAPAEVFYHGVVAACGSTSGIGGIGYVPPNPGSPGVSSARASLATHNGWHFVHELGHNIGRYHVACSGREASVDPNYPNASGNIETVGFDFGRQGLPMTDGEADARIVSTASKDFMTYCQPRWISSYGWNFAERVLTEIESWAQAPMARERVPTLMGIVSPGGSQWWTALEPRIEFGDAPTADIEFRAEGETILRARAEVSSLSDDASYMVRAELGDAHNRLESFRYALPELPEHHGQHPVLHADMDPHDAPQPAMEGEVDMGAINDAQYRLTP